ncbi:MAG: hypothetical protein IJU92_02895, partial [Spirochaetaceae bacterium]|nr:hypothetical protein [Spirochaetaceae bacterium]
TPSLRATAKQSLVINTFDYKQKYSLRFYVSKFRRNLQIRVTISNEIVSGLSPTRKVTNI